jgi:hypothetical protein
MIATINSGAQREADAVLIAGQVQTVRKKLKGGGGANTIA